MDSICRRRGKRKSSLNTSRKSFEEIDLKLIRYRINLYKEINS